MGSKFYGKFSFFVVLMIVGALALYSPFIRDFFIHLTTGAERVYLHTKERLRQTLEEHWDQIATIGNLRENVRKLEKELLLCRSDVANYHALKKALGVKPAEENLSVVAVQAYGYVRLGNFQQVWLELFEGYDPMRNYGVVRDGFAVGIVVEKRRRPLMILAGDKECSFAVYIGSQRAPGIATGKSAKTMVVKYIPEWMKINPGDTVSTSGLDRLFPPGVPVGRVRSIQKMQGFKNAEIELFGDTLHPDFVWVTAR